jgi:alpha-D-ribose 1-methylphosphonate 5-triphosphate synthase subunit PhnG
VEVNHAYGYGILMGENDVKAYRLAVVDAAIRGEAQETAAWEAALKEAELAIAERLRAEQRRVSRTKVNFDTMGEYHERNQ